jgi:hypothetical protein
MARWSNGWNMSLTNSIASNVNILHAETTIEI